MQSVLCFPLNKKKKNIHQNVHLPKSSVSDPHLSSPLLFVGSRVDRTHLASEDAEC